MAKISTWEKIRKAIFRSYSEKLTYQLAQEKAEQLAAAKMAEKARLEAAAAKKKAAEAAAKAESARVAKVKADAERMAKNAAAAKPAAKKPASTGKTASTTPKKATAKKPAPKKATGYKANAVDGDGDGLVQDGTPFERPAAPKKKATGTGGSSATKKRR